MKTNVVIIIAILAVACVLILAWTGLEALDGNNPAKNNEKWEKSFMRKMVWYQDRFRARTQSSSDPSGYFATFRQLAGSETYVVQGERRTLFSPYLEEDWTKGGVVKFSDFWWRLDLSADQQTYVCMVWPSVHGETAEKTFAINQDGILLETERKYSAEASPPVGSAFKPDGSPAEGWWESGK